MNIVEALKAAQAVGATCITRLTSTGANYVIYPTDTKSRTTSGIFSDRCPTSFRYMFWSPHLADLLADDWRVFDPAEFALSEPVPLEPPVLTWINMPADDSNFKSALKTATDTEIYTAADTLADRLRAGEKVKTRLNAVEAEIKRREAKHNA